MIVNLNPIIKLIFKVTNVNLMKHFAFRVKFIKKYVINEIQL